MLILKFVALTRASGWPIAVENGSSLMGHAWTADLKKIWRLITQKLPRR
jgi:hypothetical protein